MMKEIWFKRTLFGFGWEPQTWSAWILTFLYLGLFLLMTLSEDRSTRQADVKFHLNLPAVLLIVTYFLIVYLKSEHRHGQPDQPGAEDEINKKIE